MNPDDMVTWPGVGSMTLRTAVRRYKTLPAGQILAVSLFRDGKPSILDAVDLEALAKLPEFQGEDD
jgi:hypothetical protein